MVNCVLTFGSQIWEESNVAQIMCAVCLRRRSLFYSLFCDGGEGTYGRETRDLVSCLSFGFVRQLNELARAW